MCAFILWSEIELNLQYQINVPEPELGPLETNPSLSLRAQRRPHRLLRKAASPGQTRLPRPLCRRGRKRGRGKGTRRRTRTAAVDASRSICSTASEELQQSIKQSPPPPPPPSPPPHPRSIPLSAHTSLHLISLLFLRFGVTCYRNWDTPWGG